MRRLRALAATASLAAVAALAAAAPVAAAPPANDAFAAAQPIAEPGIAGTVRDATREATEPQHAELETPQTVWYRFVSPTTRPVALRTCGQADFDTVIAVYTGTAVGGLGEVTSNDDACGLQSQVSFFAAANQVYRIAVSSFEPTEGTAGAFTLALGPAVPPVNDDFADAIQIRSAGQRAGSNLSATTELGEPSTGRKTVWYRLRAGRTQTWTIDTAGSSFDTLLAVYRGTRLGDLRRVGFNDDVSEDVSSRLRLRLRRGVTYWIAVAGIGADGGDFLLNLSDGGARAVGLELATESGQTVSTLRARGLRTLVSSRRPCRVRLELLIGPRTARRLGFRSRAIARTEGVLDGLRDERVAALRLSRSASRLLRGRGPLRVAIRATLVGSGARDRTIARRLTLPR